MDVFQPWGDCVVEGVATLRCVPIVFQNVVTAALMFAGIVALFFIIISGYKFMTSGGDPKQLEGARKTMIYAILGLVLILLSFAIVQFISVSTGVKCINSFSFNNCDTAEIRADAIQKDADIGDTVGRTGGQKAEDITNPNGDSSGKKDKKGGKKNKPKRGGNKKT